MPERKDLFQCIAANKCKSVLLVGLLGGLLLALAGTFSYAYGGQDWPFFFVFSGGLALTYILIGYFAGGDALMALSGAREADPEKERQLYNVVEEMTIAGGLPMPKVYVMEEEESPNAFATGRNPSNSAVAVTRGLLRRLNREELQGVIAHELSHVGNYDILFSTLVCFLVGAIAILARFFSRMLFFGGGRSRSRSSSGKSGGNGQAIIMLVALVLMVLAPFISVLVQFAISREREYLADATAAKLTRNPEGLARALEKIAADDGAVEAASGATKALFIANPMKKGASGEDASLFATHPPIRERIARLRAMC